MLSSCFHPQCQFQPDTLLRVDNLPLKWKKKMAQNYFFVFPACVLCRFFWMNHKLISPKMSNFLPLTCVYRYQPFIKSNLFKKTNFSCKNIYVMYEYIKCFLWKCQIFKNMFIMFIYIHLLDSVKNEEDPFPKSGRC